MNTSREDILAADRIDPRYLGRKPEVDWDQLLDKELKRKERK